MGTTTHEPFMRYALANDIRVRPLSCPNAGPVLAYDSVYGLTRWGMGRQVLLAGDRIAGACRQGLARTRETLVPAGRGGDGCEALFTLAWSKGRQG